MTTDTTFCGSSSPHPVHTWPTDARHPDDTFTCDGRPATTHPVTLRKVSVPFLGIRWTPTCAVCGSLSPKPLDRESAEFEAKTHEGRQG